ncbi:unnamed protein product, partial [Rotaria sordida]
MTNTFLSTSKRSDVADMFAAYNRTEHKLDGEDKEGEVSIGYTFIIKNINGYRRALDISDISERPNTEYGSSSTSSSYGYSDIPLISNARRCPSIFLIMNVQPIDTSPSLPSRSSFCSVRLYDANISAIS